MQILKIHENDNVAVAIETIAEGTAVNVNGTEVIANTEIPAGHKMALRDIAEGEQVIKYGCPIGNAKEAVKKGDWIHVHNVKTGLGDLLTYTYEPVDVKNPEGKEVFFNGFKRKDGKAGVRNEIWIIPTVGCVNNVAGAIAKQANAYVKGSVEEVISFPHPYGCSQMGDDQEHTRTILADLINHPNAGGVLVL
ncbi:MAG: UxaA family hydrolase, partial [Lachnospiraceae bacterium]|nr:UxaA family hydrolase [Lachnospiraceae bacterium]